MGKNDERAEEKRRMKNSIDNKLEISKTKTKS